MLGRKDKEIEKTVALFKHQGEVNRNLLDVNRCLLAFCDGILEEQSALREDLNIIRVQNAILLDELRSQRGKAGS